MGPARAAGAPPPHCHLLITPAPAKSRTCAEGARLAVRTRAMHAGTPRRSGTSSRRCAEPGQAAVLLHGAPTWPRGAGGTASPSSQAAQRRRRARWPHREQVSRSPRCPSNRGEVPSSASSDEHGAPMVAWAGVSGGGLAVARLPQARCLRGLHEGVVDAYEYDGRGGGVAHEATHPHNLLDGLNVLLRSRSA